MPWPCTPTHPPMSPQHSCLPNWRERWHNALDTSNFALIHYGTIPDGDQGQLGEFHCASIYGAGTSADHCNIWKTLRNTLPLGDWIFAGDFNFTKSTVNSTTQALLLIEQELDKWRSLKSQFGLLDVFNILHGVDGPRFTCQRSINGTLKQSGWTRSIKSSRLVGPLHGPSLPFM